MKRISTLGLIGLFILLFSSLLQAEDPKYIFPTNCHQVQFDGIRKLILVEASVNDKSGWFVLDTGMKDLFLNTLHFSVLPAKEVPDSISLIDVKGNIKLTRVVDVQSFQWGEIQRKEFLTLGADLSTMEKVLKREILGLIGMEVVRHLELIVDYQNEILTIRQPMLEGGCGGCAQQPDFTLFFAYQNHLPAIKATVGNQNEMWLGLDTGSSLSLIDEQQRRKLRKKTHSVTKIRYGSPNGIYEIPLANVTEIDLGKGLEFSYWRFGFNSLEHFHRCGMYIDGLLGGDLFRLGKVSINFADQRVQIWLEETSLLQRYPALLSMAAANKKLEAEVNSELTCLSN